LVVVSLVTLLVISVVILLVRLIAIRVVTSAGHYDPVITKKSYHGENNSVTSRVKVTPA
jgi:hypothetical protein